MEDEGTIATTKRQNRHPRLVARRRTSEARHPSPFLRPIGRCLRKFGSQAPNETRLASSMVSISCVPYPPFTSTSSPFVSTTTRALFGDHYYSPSARLSQICSRADGFCFWYRAPKKMAGSVNFGPNSFFGGLDFFPRPPLSDPRGKKFGARKCAEVCGKCAESVRKFPKCVILRLNTLRI